jgi:hypothetical protein
MSAGKTERTYRITIDIEMEGYETDPSRALRMRDGVENLFERFGITGEGSDRVTRWTHKIENRTPTENLPVGTKLTGMGGYFEGEVIEVDHFADDPYTVRFFCRHDPDRKGVEWSFHATPSGDLSNGEGFVLERAK